MLQRPKSWLVKAYSYSKEINVKPYSKSIRLFLILIVLFVLVACNSDNSTSEPPPSTNAGRNPTATPRPTGTADLTISNVSISGIDPQQGSPYFRFEGVVRNTGNADAIGFEAGCTYKCPGGPVLTGGFDLVQGGYLSANDSFTFSSVNRISCDPVPAILTDVTCDVDAYNDVVESAENNNTFNPGQLSVPFN